MSILDAHGTRGSGLVAAVIRDLVKVHPGGRGRGQGEEIRVGQEDELAHHLR